MDDATRCPSFRFEQLIYHVNSRSAGVVVQYRDDMVGHETGEVRSTAPAPNLGVGEHAPVCIVDGVDDAFEFGDGILGALGAGSWNVSAQDSGALGRPASNTAEHGRHGELSDSAFEPCEYFDALFHCLGSKRAAGNASDHLAGENEHVVERSGLQRSASPVVVRPLISRHPPERCDPVVSWHLTNLRTAWSHDRPTPTEPGAQHQQRDFDDAAHFSTHNPGKSNDQGVRLRPNSALHFPDQR
jgi:hypothetical protein